MQYTKPDHRSHYHITIYHWLLYLQITTKVSMHSVYMLTKWAPLVKTQMPHDEIEIQCKFLIPYAYGNIFF